MGVPGLWGAMDLGVRGVGGGCVLQFTQTRHSSPRSPHERDTRTALFFLKSMEECFGRREKETLFLENTKVLQYICSAFPQAGGSDLWEC